MNIYPRFITSDEFNSSAEKGVYDKAVDSELFSGDSSRFLFHSVKNPTPGNYKLLGETDFIYLDRKIILFIEVKGGQVKYDSLTNNWWVMGGTNKKDPFAQVAGNLFNYRDKKLPKLFNDNRMLNKRLIFGYCVFFPDCMKPDAFNKYNKNNIEYDPELIIDYNDLESKSFKTIIKDLSNYWENHSSYKSISFSGLSGQELFKIKNFIRKDIIFQLPWTDLLKKNDLIYRRYTDESQESLLAQLNDNKNIGSLVKGGPGTGKTWMALEHAKRLDVNGKKVLFLCYNKFLYGFLQEQVNILEAKNVDVYNIDLLYSEVLKNTFSETINDLHIKWQSENVDMQDIDNNLFWSREVPIHIFNLFKNYDIDRYDYIIMDEAQDYFNEFHIDAIQCFLKQGFESGNFMICMDNLAQDFYLSYDEEFEEYFKSIYPTYISRLTKNCRNPQKLSDTAFDFTGIIKQNCYFKDEVKASQVKYYSSIDDLKNKVLTFVEQKKIEKVDSNNITILSFDKSIIPQLVDFNPKLFAELSKETLFDKNKILVSTAHSFKGLENHFILFIGPLSFKTNDIIQEKVTFNAFTRAKHQFVYFMDLKFQDAIDTKYTTNIMLNK